MPELKSYAPSERAQQIIALAREALEGADEVRARIRRSTEAALECGRLLLKEKAQVNREHGHGAWEMYYDATFAQTVPERTARHWMKQAKTAIAVSRSRSSPNDLRNAVLTLGLFPPKQHVMDPNEVGARANETLPQSRLNNHHSVINRFNEWWMLFNDEVESGQVGPAEAEQILTDFEPVVRCIDTLRTTVEKAKA